MTTRKRFLEAIGCILLLGLLISLGPVSAQGGPYPHTLILQVSSAPAGPPEIEQPAEGWTLFRVNPVGSVTGDLEGSFTQRITQIDPCATCDLVANQLEPIACFFTIETGEGTIEGYYVGAFYPTAESLPDQFIKVRGQILSVTGAYTNLYLADVYYDGVVDFEEVDGVLTPLGDSGTMVIAPQGPLFTNSGG